MSVFIFEKRDLCASWIQDAPNCGTYLFPKPQLCELGTPTYNQSMSDAEPRGRRKSKTISNQKTSTRPAVVKWCNGVRWFVLLTKPILLAMYPDLRQSYSGKV
jgi:hypothetical protein